MTENNQKYLIPLVKIRSHDNLLSPCNNNNFSYIYDISVEKLYDKS